MNQEAEIKELKDKITRLENILFGLSNDVRFQATIRNAVIIGEHTANKPIVINARGKKYNLQTV